MDFIKVFTDGSIFGLLETLKNEYSVVSTMILFPLARWLWNKYKKATPWVEPEKASDIPAPMVMTKLDK